MGLPAAVPAGGWRLLARLRTRPRLLRGSQNDLARSQAGDAVPPAHQRWLDARLPRHGEEVVRGKRRRITVIWRAGRHGGRRAAGGKLNVVLGEEGAASQAHTPTRPHEGRVPYVLRDSLVAWSGPRQSQVPPTPRNPLTKRKTTGLHPGAC